MDRRGEIIKDISGGKDKKTTRIRCCRAKPKKGTHFKEWRLVKSVKSLRSIKTENKPLGLTVRKSLVTLTKTNSAG